MPGLVQHWITDSYILHVSMHVLQCLCKTSAHIMNNMSALDEALDILPFTA